MKRSLVSIALTAVVFLLLCRLTPPVVAQSANPPANPFELKDGDRVVFLGNSLFENDVKYGYLEYALTTRWPDRHLTFRNLGWTGDNVFGEARSYFTNPPTPYELLLKQLTDAQPTVVFVAYGGIEAQEGEAGLPRFRDGLTKLLDKINQLGAKAVLLSPIPVLAADTPENLTQRNASLTQYAAEIARIASARGLRYVDVFKPMQAISKTANVAETGVYLNETGYYHLATVLETGLGLPPRSRDVTISVGKSTTAAAPVVLRNAAPNALTFTLDDTYLPLPLPEEDSSTVDGRPFRISGLKKGFYTLSANNEDVTTGSAKKWADGMTIRQGTLYAQAAQLRQMIQQKNDLFFFQYRPLNRTYIIGFRSYEQGRHVKGLEEQTILIKWLEGQIALHSKPRQTVYQLTQLK